MLRDDFSTPIRSMRVLDGAERNPVTLTGLNQEPPRPIKIMTCIHSLDPGGVERVALRLNAAWRDLGVETCVVVGRRSDTACSGATRIAQGLRCITISGAEGVGRRTQLMWMLRNLPAIIRAERPDILFCPGNTYSSVAVGMRLILGRDCPPIVTKVSNDLKRRDMGMLLRFGYHRWLRIQGRFIDRFVAMAPAMVDEIASATGTPRQRIAIVNDPVLRGSELARFAGIHRASAVPGKGRHFMSIGRLMPQKNFGLLLAAFARMASPADRLTILGEGPERPLLTAQAKSLGIDDRVAMPGHVADLARWLADADIFVMSSDYEGVPAVLIEAIAANLSVVATDCSTSMGDLVGHGRFGTLVPVGDDAALAAAMDAAPSGQSDPAAALDHARRFTLERGAADYLALMRDMVRERALTPA